MFITLNTKPGPGYKDDIDEVRLKGAIHLVKSNTCVCTCWLKCKYGKHDTVSV